MLLIKILIFLLLFIFVLVLLICMVPFNYQASGDSEKKQFDFKVTWLFHLIGFSGNYKFDEGLNYRFSIFGISMKVDRGKKDIKRRKSIKQQTKKKVKKDKTGFRDLLIERETFKYIFLNVKKVFKHILPRKFEASGVLGFEDPYHTSILCSFVEILRGFRFHNLQIQYVFYNQVYQGRFYLKGKIYLIYIAYIALKLMLNKSVRKLIFNK